VGEDRLRADLQALGDRFRDEEFSSDLYRALANRKWSKAGAVEPVALSWSLAEELVNELRQAIGYQPIELAQTGGEGDVSPVVADELGRLGWTSEPLDTSRNDESHVEKEESPPPRDAGARSAPTDDAAG
jgi:hypothetical protein